MRQMRTHRSLNWNRRVPRLFPELSFIPSLQVKAALESEVAAQKERIARAIEETKARAHNVSDSCTDELQDLCAQDKRSIERELIRLQSTVDMIGAIVSPGIAALSAAHAGAEIVEKELSLVETQSLLEQSKAELLAAQHESAMAGTYKKEVDELSVYLQEYQTKANNKVPRRWVCAVLMIADCNSPSQFEQGRGGGQASRCRAHAHDAQGALTVQTLHYPWCHWLRCL